MDIIHCCYMKNMFWKLVCFLSSGEKRGQNIMGSVGKSLFQSLDQTKNKMIDNVRSIKIRGFTFVKNIQKWTTELSVPSLYRMHIRHS
jgi:hypothetical protein